MKEKLFNITFVKDKKFKRYFKSKNFEFIKGECWPCELDCIGIKNYEGAFYDIEVFSELSPFPRPITYWRIRRINGGTRGE